MDSIGKGKNYSAFIILWQQKVNLGIWKWHSNFLTCTASLPGTLERPWSCRHVSFYAVRLCLGVDSVSTVHKMTATVLWLSVSALWSLPELQREIFLLLCPFLLSTGGRSLELLPVLIPQKLSTWQWNTASGEQGEFSCVKKSSSSCMRGLKSTLKAPSTEGSAFSQFAAGCSILHCWCPQGTPLLTQQPCLCRGLAALSFSARPLESPWEGSFAEHTGSFWGGMNDRKLYPRRWKIPSA